MYCAQPIKATFKQDGKIQGDALSLLLFNLDLEHAIRKAVENREGLEQI